jgi:thiol-disulfide isomerase/thioredoxin
MPKPVDLLRQKPWCWNAIFLAFLALPTCFGFALFSFALISFALFAPPVFAQTSAASVSAGSTVVGKLVSIHGPTTKKQPFNLAQLQGKVVMLFFWSTDCAVCLDKLPELRRNLTGWRGKDFAIIAVNQDRHQQDLLAYEKVLKHAVPDNAELDKQMKIIWRKDPAYKDNLGVFPMRASTTVVLGRDGKVITTVQGRISNDVWDDIAAELASN